MKEFPVEYTAFRWDPKRPEFFWRYDVEDAVEMIYGAPIYMHHLREEAQEFIGEIQSVNEKSSKRGPMVFCFHILVVAWMALDQHILSQHLITAAYILFFVWTITFLALSYLVFFYGSPIPYDLDSADIEKNEDIDQKKGDSIQLLIFAINKNYQSASVKWNMINVCACFSAFVTALMFVVYSFAYAVC